MDHTNCLSFYQNYFNKLGRPWSFQNFLLFWTVGDQHCSITVTIIRNIQTYLVAVIVYEKLYKNYGVFGFLAVSKFCLKCFFLVSQLK